MVGDEESISISISDARQLLCRALPALVSGDTGAIELFTDDVCGDAPNMCVRSRKELEQQLTDRAGALSSIEFRIDYAKAVNSGVLARWRMAGEHTGEVLFNEDELIEPTGRRILLLATTRVQFRTGRICEFQTTYDDHDLFDQLRNRPPPGGR
jgi:hypothetical protein